MTLPPLRPQTPGQPGPLHAFPAGYVPSFERRAELRRARRRQRLLSPFALVTYGAMFCAAVLLVGQAVWEQWGSDVYAEQRQATLAAEFSAHAAQVPTTVAVTAPAAAPLPPLDLPSGAVARLTAETIGLDAIVVTGIGTEPLKSGPGWDDRGVFPGERGNATISGHRTTYGGPFRQLDELQVGDRITVEAPGRPVAVFEVRESFVVEPGDVWVSAPTDGVRLTLTTCHPEGDDTYRLVVQAELVEGANVAFAVPADRWSRSAG